MKLQRSTSCVRALLLFVLVCPLGGRALAQGEPIGYVETFALAADRARALEQLVPGSVEHYYYSCLHHQNEGELARVDELLQAWRERHGSGQELRERIELRQTLLRAGQSPFESYQALVRRLDLRFDQQPDLPGAVRDLPTRLDPTALDEDAWLREALRRHDGSLKGIGQGYLPRIAGLELDDARLRELLDRLRRPDVPGLADLVVRELRLRDSRGFGSLGIHGHLLLPQLEECHTARPQLLGDSSFVNTYLKRLLPGADEVRDDPRVRAAHLDRLEGFTARLPEAFDGLKAHVLYHRLALDLELGTPDQARLLAYLRLARQPAYADPVLRRDRPAVALAQVWSTDLAPIPDDEPLVREHLGRLFERSDSFESFAGVLRREYVQRIFAETKILTGAPQPERWFALLGDPRVYEELKDRVELTFLRGLPRTLAPDEPVVLEVDVKNVETLLVKVFEIDAVGFYTSQSGAGRVKDIDASIDLDGLVAHHEQTHVYAESPLVRVRRRFEFPAVDRPGVYVIELIGKGLASRAVIRKGDLSFVERIGAAGHVLRILDQDGEPAPDATLLFAGREYAADARGEILIPFTADLGRRQVILRRGELAVLDSFEHASEIYALDAAVHVEREALLAGERAQLLVRARLRVADRRVSLALLEEPRLELSATDLDGVVTTSTVRGLALTNDGELVHELLVPQRTASLTARLVGSVKSLSEARSIELVAPPVTLPINGIDATDEIWAPLLTLDAQGYALEVRGKNGEPAPGRVVRVELVHRDFVDARRFQLQADAAGRIELGSLPHIVGLELHGLGAAPFSFDVSRPVRSGAQRQVHALEGATIHIPYPVEHGEPSARAVSLLELRGGEFAFERLEAISFAGPYLLLRGLPAGDFSLLLHASGERYDVRVVDGRRVGVHGLGDARRLELSRPLELAIDSAGIEGEDLVVRLAGAGPATRVHVSAMRYVPAFDPHRRLALEALRSLALDPAARVENQYESGRRISDEYRYILERRFAPRFAGNMLERAGLLLNPWAVDEATEDSSAGEGSQGGRFGGRAGGQRARGGLAQSPGAESLVGRSQSFANLDFLAEPAVVLANLRPDADGVLRVPLADLPRGNLLRVVAVDEAVTLSRTVVRPRSAPELRERRLEAGLDPAVHRVEERRIEVLAAGEGVTFSDATNAGAEVYDSLDDVFGLLRTLGEQPELERFEFLLRWPLLEETEKLARYSEFAGHELHVFLRRKDPDFFGRVVRPYLANKAHKTFLDHWLLGADLGRYLEPWAFDQLNTFERILLLREVGGRPERHVRDRIELLPPERFALRTYFAAVLSGRALESDRGELGDALEDRKAKADKVYRGPGDSRASGAPSAPGAAGRQPSEDAEVTGDDWFLGADVEVARELEGLGYTGEALLDLDAGRRQELQSFFQALGETRELAERHYWRLPLDEMDADWITPTPFWLDFAETAPGEPFLSSRFPLATRNLSEMLLALALLDLPFEAAAHQTEPTPEGPRFTAASPLFLARRGLARVEPAAVARPILVGQDFFRLDDPFMIEDGRRRDKLVSGEFLVGVPYGCRVVVTNPSSAPIEVEVLLQIPHGALPVRSGSVTRGVPVSLDGYGSASLEYAFYFPRAGSFRHYPVHVGEDGALLAFAEPASLDVVGAPSALDPTSWEHLSQAAQLPTLLAHLDQANLAALDLSRLAWRMGDRDAYEAILELLRRRQTFEPTLWSFGLYHGDPRTSREFLEHRSDVVAAAGPWLRSALLVIEPRERRLYEHLEYEPLVNGRTHRFGPERRIYNESFARQYRSFLTVLAHKPALEDLDHLALVYYMCLQARVEEALAHFARVDPARIDARLQYDYLAAYLAFYSPEPSAARAIAEAHADHPVPRWRARFRDVLAQLDEAEGRGAAGVSDPGSRGQRQGALAADAPTLELSVEARRVTVLYSNLDQVEVRYRPMDIELLFSTSPFLEAGSGSFSALQPHRVDRFELPPERDALVLDLPLEFTGSNVLVEVRGGGLVRTQAYYAGDLRLQTMESYGQLAVRRASDGAPLPAAYVKVYARLEDGRVRFHLDGYTDLRGRFDYVSVSGNSGPPVARYAVLVLSEDHGALVRELHPPQR